jgi:hypothetical protein
MVNLRLLVAFLLMVPASVFCVPFIVLGFLFEIAKGGFYLGQTAMLALSKFVSNVAEEYSKSKS